MHCAAALVLACAQRAEGLLLYTPSLAWHIVQTGRNYADKRLSRCCALFFRRGFSYSRCYFWLVGDTHEVYARHRTGSLRAVSLLALLRKSELASADLSLRLCELEREGVLAEIRMRLTFFFSQANSDQRDVFYRVDYTFETSHKLFKCSTNDHKVFGARNDFVHCLVKAE